MEEQDRNKLSIQIDMELEQRRQKAIEKGLPPYRLNNFFLRSYDNDHRRAISSNNPEQAKLVKRIDEIINELGIRERLDALLQISARAHRPTNTQSDFQYTSQQREQADLEIDELLVPVYKQLRYEGYDPEKVNITV